MAWCFWCTSELNLHTKMSFAWVHVLLVKHSLFVCDFVPHPRSRFSARWHNMRGLLSVAHLRPSLQVYELRRCAPLLVVLSRRQAQRQASLCTPLHACSRRVSALVSIIVSRSTLLPYQVPFFYTFFLIAWRFRCKFKKSHVHTCLKSQSN